MQYRDGCFWDEGRKYSTEPVVYLVGEEGFNEEKFIEHMKDRCGVLETYVSDEQAIRVPIMDTKGLYAVVLFERL